MILDAVKQLAQAVAGKGRPQDFIWAIEPESFQRYLSQSADVDVEQVARVGRSGSKATIGVHGVMTRDVNDRIASAILDAAADEDVDSIVLEFDTPGGTVSGLAEAGDAIQMAKSEKPVTSNVVGMLASAGYYLAAQTDSITARRMDMVGSIGTRLALMDTSKFADMIGMKPIVVDTGEFKSLGAFGTEVTENHVGHLQEIVNAFFADFKSVVVAGRGSKLLSFDAVANGKIWTAEEAKTLGLIDQVAQPVKAGQGRSVNSGARNVSTETKPQPATYKQLKDALPNASSDFICSQQEKDATVEQAKDAWADHLAEENTRILAENAELKAKKVVAAKSGVKADSLSGTDNVSPPEAPFSRDTFYSYVGQVAKEEFSHLPEGSERRRAAVAKIMRENPEACEAMRAPAKR